MKKVYFSLLGLALLAVSMNSLGQGKPLPLGRSSDLLQNFRQQMNSTQQLQGISRLQLKVEGDILRGKVNHRHATAKDNEFVVGEIEQTPGSSFFFQVEGPVVKGNIVLRKSRKAYVYYSDGSGNAYLKEEDIQKVLCVDYLKAPEPKGAATAANASVSIAAVTALADLQSYPAGVGCVLLDFDGQVVSGTLWNGGNTISAAPATLNDTEKEQVWELISEDYRPFRLNVTTSEAVYNTYPANRRMRCIF